MSCLSLGLCRLPTRAATAGLNHRIAAVQVPDNVVHMNVMRDVITDAIIAHHDALEMDVM